MRAGEGVWLCMQAVHGPARTKHRVVIPPQPALEPPAAGVATMQAVRGPDAMPLLGCAWAHVSQGDGMPWPAQGRQHAELQMEAFPLS